MITIQNKFMFSKHSGQCVELLNKQWNLGRENKNTILFG